MPVSFQYQIFSFKIKNQKHLVNWFLTVAFLENKEIEKIDFVFCNDEFLVKLNEKFLKHKTLTDILTFDDSTKRQINAEVYISIPRVKENATYFKVGFIDELYRVMIHGLLHCCGYRDKSEKEKKLIRRKEDEYLQLLHQL
jgi:probable rRNA maturation factor